MGKDEEEKEMSSFSYSSFNTATFATAIDAATVDAAKAPTKDGSEDGAADKTVGDNRLFHERRTE